MSVVKHKPTVSDCERHRSELVTVCYPESAIFECRRQRHNASAYVAFHQVHQCLCISTNEQDKPLLADCLSASQ